MSEIALYEAQIDAVDALSRTQDVATKADLARLEARMADMKAELIKWMVGLWLGGIGFIIAAMALVLRFFLPGAA